MLSHGQASPAQALPTGTVTFLFTDIEGSTRLLERLGTADYADVLARHQWHIRQALEAAGGVEVKTEGDAFFVVFRSAPAAVAAAAAAQRGLAGERWPDGVDLRVRMGLHTGEGVLAPDSDYVGLDVHRAARIAAAGHGGQVLISETTRGLVEGALPAGVTIRDLGEHRLKDLSRSERLAQLVITGLLDHFPPLRTLDATPNNLPILATSFVGRTREVEAARRLLATSRLLTLTGPGGTGKTRLALQLAAESIEVFPDGVFFVPLEPITDPALVATTIAGVLGVQEVGSEPVERLLADFLRPRRLLLVLDNFEQVTEGARVVGDLLKAAPDLRVVVTSRAVLRLYGEQEYPVPPLGTPDPANLPPLEALAQYEAVALFIARAMAARPDFAVTNENAPAVAQITARLDGLPLAIELAAARTKLLSPQAMLPRLESRLALLGGAGARDLPARQQTLRGAIAWSFDLLDETGRCLFARVSTFVGGFDLEAAEAICSPPTAGHEAVDVLAGLSDLADQSLVRRADEHDHVRFDMLETIREFAAEKLAASGEADEIRRRHAAYFTDLAERAAPQLTGAQRAVWLDLVQHEHDNLRAALSRAIEAGDATTGLRLVAALWRFWQSRAYLVEGAARAAAVLALPADDVDLAIRARAFDAAGGLAYWMGDMERSNEAYQQALAFARQVGDRRMIADQLYNLGFTYIMPRSDLAEGLRIAEEAAAIYRELGHEHGLVNALWEIGSVHYFSGDWERAAEVQAETLDKARRTGNAFIAGWALHMLGTAEVKLGRFSLAYAHLAEALRAMVADRETTGIVLVLDDFAELAAAIGDVPRSLRLEGAARTLQDQTGTGLAGFANAVMNRSRLPTGDLTADEVARLRAEGRALTTEAAVALALETAVPGT